MKIILSIGLLVAILLMTTFCICVGIKQGKFKNSQNKKPSVSGLVLYMQTKNPIALTL